MISFHEVLLNAKINKELKPPKDSAPVAAVKTGTSMRRTINQNSDIAWGWWEEVKENNSKKWS